MEQEQEEAPKKNIKKKARMITSMQQTVEKWDTSKAADCLLTASEQGGRRMILEFLKNRQTVQQ